MSSVRRRGPNGWVWSSAPWVVLAIALAALLSGCASTSSAATQPTTTPTGVTPTTATPTPVPVLRFQADWSRGLTGWNATPGWTIAGGALQSDGGDSESITIPYTPATPNYSLEAHLQITEVVGEGGYVSMDAPPQPSAAGYSASVYSLLPPGPRPFALHPTVSVVIEPETDQQNPTRDFDFEPRAVWRTYRVDVRDSYVLFYVDGQLESSAVSTTKRLSNGPLQLGCSGAAIRVDSLKIFSL